MKVDKKHSLVWDDGQNKFFILKEPRHNAFILSVFDNGKPHHVFFTADDFSSLVCEIVKYCLDLPTVARQIPCPINLSKKFHCCLQTQKASVRDGQMVVPLDKRWLEYHGYPEELVARWEKGALYIMPKAEAEHGRTK